MSKKHPLQERDLYTPMNEDVRHLLERMRVKHGSWRMVAEVSDTRVKVLRNVRNKRKTISMRLLDRLITATGVGEIENYEWFTAEDLEALGVWDPPVRVEGRRRIQADKEWEGQGKKIKPKKKKRPPSKNEFGIPIQYLENLPPTK